MKFVLPCSRSYTRVYHCICVSSRTIRRTCRWTRSTPPSSCRRRTCSSSSSRPCPRPPHHPLLPLLHHTLHSSPPLSQSPGSGWGQWAGLSPPGWRRGRGSWGTECWGWSSRSWSCRRLAPSLTRTPGGSSWRTLCSRLSRGRHCLHWRRSHNHSCRRWGCSAGRCCLWSPFWVWLIVDILG